LVCHQNKLSGKSVQVSWQRDGKYIVGSIFMDGQKFMTQALSAKEFVEMVNDTIYAAYDIPPKYIKKLGSDYYFRPSQEEFEKLNNQAVKKAVFNFSGTMQKIPAVA